MGGEQAAHKMKGEGVEDPVRWTLEQLKTRFPTMVKQAGYEEIAEGQEEFRVRTLDSDNCVW